ncbi:hypothetical protein M9458_056063, partial [Cirrhinus mrigala]
MWHFLPKHSSSSAASSRSRPVPSQQPVKPAPSARRYPFPKRQGPHPKKEIRILNYLDDWLILAQLEDELLSHRSFLLSHLDCLGLRKMLGLMASASTVLQLGLLQMRPLQQWLNPRVPSHTWRHGCLRVKVDQACVEVVSTDASNSGWGALCDGKPAFGHWSERESRLHISCLEMLAHLSAQFAFAKSDTCARHPQMVQIIWEIFGKAEVNHFAPEDNSHCPTYFSKNKDVLTHEWPNLLLYTFPMVALIPQVIRRVRDQKHKVLYQYWFAELSQPLSAAPWPILSGEQNNMAPS